METSIEESIKQYANETGLTGKALFRAWVKKTTVLEMRSLVTDKMNQWAGRT
jgi:hypothetical protein